MRVLIEKSALVEQEAPSRVDIQSHTASKQPNPASHTRSNDPSSTSDSCDGSRARQDRVGRIVEVVADHIATFFRWDISQLLAADEEKSHEGRISTESSSVPSVQVEIFDNFSKESPKRPATRRRTRSGGTSHEGNSAGMSLAQPSPSPEVFTVRYEDIADVNKDIAGELETFLRNSAATTPTCETTAEEALRRCEHWVVQDPDRSRVVVIARWPPDKTLSSSTLSTQPNQLLQLIGKCKEKNSSVTWVSPCESENHWQSETNSQSEEFSFITYRKLAEDFVIPADCRGCLASNSLKLSDPAGVLSSEREVFHIATEGSAKGISEAKILKTLPLGSVQPRQVANGHAMDTDVLWVSCPASRIPTHVLLHEPELCILQSESTDALEYSAVILINRSLCLGIKNWTFSAVGQDREHGAERALALLGRFIRDTPCAVNEKPRIATGSCSTDPAEEGMQSSVGEMDHIVVNGQVPFTTIPHTHRVSLKEQEDGRTVILGVCLPDDANMVFKDLYLAYAVNVLGRTLKDTQAVRMSIDGPDDPTNFVLHSIPSALMSLENALGPQNLKDPPDGIASTAFKTPWLPFEMLLFNTEMDVSISTWKILYEFVANVLTIPPKDLHDAYSGFTSTTAHVESIFPFLSSSRDVELKRLRAREVYLQLLLRFLMKSWTASTVYAETANDLPLICLRPRSRLKSCFSRNVAGRSSQLLQSLPSTYYESLPSQFERAESFLATTVVRIFGKRIPWLLLDLMSTIEMDVPSRLVAIEFCPGSDDSWKPCRSKDQFNSRIERPLERWQLAIDIKPTQSAEAAPIAVGSTRHTGRQVRQRKRYYKSVCRSASTNSVEEESKVAPKEDVQNSNSKAEPSRPSKQKKKLRVKSKRKGKTDHNASNEKLDKIAKHLTKDENLGYFTSALCSSHFGRPAHAKVPKRRKRSRTSKNEHQDSEKRKSHLPGKTANKDSGSNSVSSQAWKSVESASNQSPRTPSRTTDGSQKCSESTPLAQMSLQRKLSQQTPELRRQQEQDNSMKFETPMAPPPSLQRRRLGNDGANVGFSPLRSIANLEGSEKRSSDRRRQRQLQFSLAEE
eukprot:gb/GECG01000591.1/.p1 GENE.gb/GECG01000591.1/~~gb/GECG01000591.1/.p1  ORF type:complete len:1079 (+),score=108.40 gb/GECG01000591.1/:1-3237(+)